MSTDIDLICEQIIYIAGTVSSIGKVENMIYFMSDQAEIDTMLTDGRINRLGFIKFDDDPKFQESFEQEELERHFKFILYYEYRPDTNSFKIVQNISDELERAFNNNETLNKTVSTHLKLKNVGNILATSLTNKKVHILFFELTTIQEYDYN